jgi:hypothetical protein
MSYAEAIQEEGVLQPRWKAAWEEGGRLWQEYANHDMRSTTGAIIRLADQEKLEAEGKELRKQLDDLSPGLQVEMLTEAQASLSPQQKRLLAAPPAEPTAEEMQLQNDANEAISITPTKIADRIAKDHPEKAAEARRLTTLMADNQDRVNSISTNRDVANFAYWRIRCKIETTDEALEARALTHAAEKSFASADLDGAREKYERSFELWNEALAKTPELDADSTFGDDLMEFVEAYAKVLEQLDLSLADKEVADKFALWKIVEANDNQRKFESAITARQERRTGMPKDTKPLIEPSEGFLQ